MYAVMPLEKPHHIGNPLKKTQIHRTRDSANDAPTQSPQNTPQTSYQQSRKNLSPPKHATTAATTPKPNTTALSYPDKC